jgi:hypothetical protein
MIDPTHELSLLRQAQLLDLSRSPQGLHLRNSEIRLNLTEPALTLTALETRHPELLRTTRRVMRAEISNNTVSRTK